MSNAITIEVLAGMANRLRAMVSAMCLAEDLGRTLHVIWSANDPACMARFQMLFTGLPSWVTIDTGPAMGNSTMLLNQGDMEEWVSLGAKGLIRSYAHFYRKDSERWLAHLRAIKPLSYPTVPDGAIGVHIRRGDHMKARANSPLSAFIEAMEAYPPTTKFVVATDSTIEKEFLQKRFGDQLQFYAVSFSRMTALGMKSAVDDFIALSKCTEILGSYDSSFSELAAMYGNKPLRVIAASVQTPPS